MELRRTLLRALAVLTGVICTGYAESGITWEVQRYDGWYNNLALHNRGAAGASLARLLPARYADGVYQPLEEPFLPNPRRVSNAAMSGPSGRPSVRNQTVLSVFFGYHVVLEVLDSRRPGCPPEFMNIPVPEGDPVFSSTLLPLQRAHWDHRSGQSPNNPRTQVNHVTAWMDGSSIYGSSTAQCDVLRSFSGGLLETGTDASMPKRGGHGNVMWSAPDPSTGHAGTAGLYEFGNTWANENTFTVAEATVWLRYHNHLASRLQRTHLAWSDEELFQNTRKWVIATFQNIAFYEWLPAYLNQTVPDYPGYQMYVDPGISTEFQAAAMRFGLTMVPPGVYMRNRTCHFRRVVNMDGSTSPAMRLCNSFWNRDNANLRTGQDVDSLIMGMASQIAEQEDHIVVEDLRDYMYGPLRFSRSDAVAMSIQRGRDCGLPSYTQARRAFNLPAVETWGDINPTLNQTNPQLFRELAELYGNDLSRLELFPGGLLESESGPGPLFSSIIHDQFERIRNADRFWFENQQNGLFTEKEIQEIRSTTFHDVLLAVTDAEHGDIQRNVFFWQNGDPCPQPKPIRASDLHSCTKATSLSYFGDGSTAGFAILVIVLFLFPVVSFVVASLVAFLRSLRFRNFQKKSRASSADEECPAGITACEWQGREEALRSVSLALDEVKLKLCVCEPGGAELRSLSLSRAAALDVLLSHDGQRRALLLKVPKEHDLVLFFENEAKRSEFIGQLGVTVRERSVREKELLGEAVTKKERAQILEVFFRQAFAQVLDIERSDVGLRGVAGRRTREALQCELTGAELAEALSLRPDSLFVEAMFTLADKDGNGYLSFQEFLDVIVIFMKGTPEEKSKLLFSMHDVQGDGFLSKEEFSTLLRSFMEISSGCLSKVQADTAITAMLQAVGFDEKEQITWEDFHLLLRDHEEDLQVAQLNIKGMEMEGRNRLRRQQRVSFITRDRASPEGDDSISHSSVEGEVRRRQGKRPGGCSPKVYVRAQRGHHLKSRMQQRLQQFKRFVENYRCHIVCLTIIYGITAGVALERCYYYGLQADSSGVPETSLVGIIVSRGSAAAISFLFPYMLLTVCRNIITLCRETFLNRYIPFDAAIDLHRLMAMTAIILTVVHSLGHVVNFYILSISELSILACLFPQVFSNNGSELPPKWTFWFLQTVPGVTGILLLLVLSFIYVFASPYFRRVSFRGFWVTHYMYGIIYFLTVVHGSFALLQEPRFFIYLIPPSLLFLLDKLISLSRKKVQISVVKAELLPSGVTYLQFKRPPGFSYRSGQWVRVACLALGTDEYHPFTLTSAPHEEMLSLHVRAVGPWTSRLRQCYDPTALPEPKTYPKLYLDGPFGEGHQEWTDFEVSVLVGGGIGVTPFTSILKDLVFKASTRCKVQCKKVYFIWVTRTQRQFEWVSDIIREVEEMDVQDLVSVHIYITQLAEKFDIRTTMLYMCERHFQRLWSRSLFTGLRSVTHFGRPPFLSFFSSLQEVHPEVARLGVFSCGPPGLTKGVEKACQQMNKRDQVHFLHHYKNF